MRAREHKRTKIPHAQNNNSSSCDIVVGDNSTSNREVVYDDASHYIDDSVYVSLSLALSCLSHMSAPYDPTRMALR